MDGISQQEVEHVARLARLDLTDPEKALFGKQLSQILNFVGQLHEMSTEGIPPTASMAEQGAALREDLSQKGLSQELALQNAPESDQGFFVVPKILGKR